MRSAVVLINSFSVPAGMKEEFIEKWSYYNPLNQRILTQMI